MAGQEQKKLLPLGLPDGAGDALRGDWKRGVPFHVSEGERQA